MKTLSFLATILLLQGLVAMPCAAQHTHPARPAQLPFNGTVEGLSHDHLENEPEQCLSDAAHEAIRQENIANMIQLEKAGLLPPANQADNTIVGLAWPLRQAQGFSDPSFFAISNFVDHWAGTGIRDYNCGGRTYDGHRGTDIAVWPFRWRKVATGQAEVVAAAAGVIINKFDGNFDLNCTFTGNWNAVYVRHADGSVMWYGHLKKGSLTTKAIGQTVAKGEYLGVVASSGFSTGPHLHIELYADPAQTILRDPFGGPCNTLNGNQSWWDAQRPYNDPAVLALLTHSAEPVQNNNACPANTDVVNAASAFAPGATLWVSASFREVAVGMPIAFKLVQPNGAVWQSWNVTVPQNWLLAWWKFNFTLPTNAQNGTWKYQVTFQGQTFTQTFTVGQTSGCAAPINLSASNLTQNTVTLSWTNVAGATGYTVQFNVNGTWVNLNGAPIPTAVYNVYGLFAGRTYQWRALAHCPGGGFSAPSVPFTFTTPAVPNCSGGTQFPAASLTPTTSWKFQPQLWGGEYSVFNVQSGVTYTFSLCAADGGTVAFDAELSLRTMNDQVIAYADDVCGTAPRIVWRAGFTGQVRVKLTRYQCQSQNTNSTLAYRIGGTSVMDLDDMPPVDALDGRDDEAQAAADIPDVEMRAADPDSPAAREAATLTVMPNPVRDGQFVLRCAGLAPDVTVVAQVVDPLGRVLWRQVETAGVGPLEWTVPTHEWRTGIYYTHVQTTGGISLQQPVQVVR